jgi:hypothetical protein
MFAFLISGIWLLTFGFSEPLAQQTKDDAAKDDAPKKTAVKVMVGKAQERKAAPKKESKTPVADLLNGVIKELERAGEELLGERKPAARKMQVFANVQPQGNDAMIKQFEQQYGPRFHQLYKSELHLMRLVCQPTRQQFEKIAAACAADTKTQIHNYAKAVMDQRMGRFQANKPQADARKQVTSAIAQKMKETLSADQVARYAKELEERQAAERRVLILSLVCNIDRQLDLTADQREKLLDVLDKNYSKSWNRVQLMMANQYFPTMPDDKILPVLTETQKGVWRKIAKGTVYFGMTELDWFQGVEMQDEVWSELGAKK